MSGLRDGWFNAVEVGGVIKVEGIHESPSEGDSTSDLELETAELAIGGRGQRVGRRRGGAAL